MSLKSLLGGVLSEVSPSKSERSVAQRSVVSFLESLNSSLKKAGVSARAVAGGSFAKDTWLKGDFDCDIFVMFNSSYSDSQMSDILEKVLSPWKPERIHGSRDYFWVFEGVRFEIVPVLDSGAIPKNVTDFSPSHVAWVKKFGLGDEIRLAKKFCKSASCYGAESFRSGFSGHVLDILTIHYGGFLKFVRAASKWKPKVVIDTMNRFKGKALFALDKSKTVGPIVVVDPIQPNRNASAAVSLDNFVRFVKACSAFVKSPSAKFFVEKSVDLSKLKGVVIVDVVVRDGSQDVVGTKMVRAFEFVRDGLSDFVVKKSGWLWDDKAQWWFVFGKSSLSDFVERVGPPLSFVDACRHFRSVHKNAVVKKGRLVAQIKRDFTSPVSALSALLKSDFVRDRVVSARVRK